MEISGLDHVNIVTADLAGTVAFYQAALAMAELPAPAMSPDYVVRWLGDAAGRPILHVQQFNADRHSAGLVGQPTGSIDHVALQCPDFPGMVARCTDLGLDFSTLEFEGLTFRQIVLTDPNGIRLELNFPD